MNGGFSHQHISWGVDAWAGTGLLNLECDMFKVIVKKSYGGEASFISAMFNMQIWAGRDLNFPNIKSF